MKTDALAQLREYIGTPSDAEMLLFRLAHVARGTAARDEGIAVARLAHLLLDAQIRLAWPDHQFRLHTDYERTPR